MKLKKFRQLFKKFLRDELLHEYTVKDIFSDYLVYVVAFFVLSGVYVAIIILMAIISLFV